MEYYAVNTDEIKYPPWLGIPDFHKSHRMNLLRKDFDYYAEHFQKESGSTTFEIESYPYWWPTEKL